MRLWKRRLKTDDRGMAMVMVIVSIALVTLLVSVLLSISLLNYQMKVTEKKSKDNFYSAETALDQIHAGLQQIVSDATDKAYLQAMQKYKASFITEQERINEFRNTYVSEVRGELGKTGDDSSYFVGGRTDGLSMNETTGLYEGGLAGFLDKEMAAYMKSGRLELACAAAGNSMILTTQGLTLKNLRVGYTDGEGYYTEIETDIRIGFPNIKLKEASILPNVFDYSCIADDSLVFENVNGAVITDSMYAGDGGIVLNGSSNIEFNGVKYLVTKGDIVVNQGSSMKISGESIFAQGISVNGSSTRGSAPNSSILELAGSTYIADDLTMSRQNVSVTLKGDYFGYGGAEGIEEQSAILLNSGNSVLDMTGLDSLLLCGNAYINGKSVSIDEKKDLSDSVIMGTSVAMKSDQIAFLAPVECLGTRNGNLVVGRNPMTEDEYNTWLGLTGEYDKIFDVSVPVKLLNYPLSYYGLTERSYRTVFRNVNGETICYVYLNFSDAESADRYYREYMSAAKQRMQEYMSRYANEVKINTAGTDFLVKGNLLTYNVSNAQMSIINNTISSAMAEKDLENLRKQQRDYANSYKAMCSKLSTNYNALNAEELSRDVYANIIDETVLNSLVGKREYAVGADKAIVTNNASALEVGSASVNAGCSLVIASGDVVVKGHFSGLIIAGGRIVTEHQTGASIAADKETVTKLLQTKTPEDEGGKSVIATYFVNGDRYVLDGLQQEDVAYVSLESVIAYVNWSKQ